MNCPDVEPFLLDSPDSFDAEVRQHVATCAHCQAAQVALAESQTLLRGHLAVPPPPAVRTTFYTALGDMQRQQRSTTSAWRWLPIWRRSPFRLTAAFLLVFALGALSLFAVQRGEGSAAEINTVLAQLSDPSSAMRLAGVYTFADEVLDEARVREALLTVIKIDPSVNVRVAALEVLALYSSEDLVRAAVVQVLGSDPAPLVQMAALRFLETHHAADVREALDALLEQPDLEPLVRAQIHTLLTASI